MNRVFRIFAICLCQLVLYAQAGQAADYQLKLSVTPERAGDIYNGTIRTVTAGDEVYIESYRRSSNYKLLYWKDQHGEIVSDQYYFTYTMPEADTELTAVYEFSPESPSNPESAENMYKLILQCVPANAGSIMIRTETEGNHYQNKNDFIKVNAGKTFTAYADSYNESYRFREWQVNGETVGTERGLEYTMPAENTILTAIYDFNPVSPDNPGSNSWDEQSGIVILDDFKPGDAEYALSRVTEGNFDNVYTLIMAGTITAYDPGVVRNCSSCTELDFSRTTGTYYLPSWIFENTKSLATISIPACIEKIHWTAFSGCDNLAALNLYAVTPPDVNGRPEDCDSFLNVFKENVTVYVPATSVSLYNEADVWKNFVIKPLTFQVRDLEVSLSNDGNFDVSPYKDMYLELLNLSSGQKQRYVITDRVTYTFSSLIKNTNYDVYLKDAKGNVLGSILGIEIKEDDVSRTFGELKTPKDVTLSVTAGGSDVTDQVTVVWADANGNYLAQGATLKNLLAGNVVKYHVSLGEALAMQYLLPAEVEYTVDEGENTPTLSLEAIPTATLSGTVTDYNQDNAALAGAIVSISQTLNGQYTKTYSTKTDADGKWTVNGFLAPSEITASKVGYVSQTKELALEDMATTTNVPAFELKDINGTTVNVNLAYQPVNGEQTAYNDVNNVAFTLMKEDGEDITGFSVQDSKLVLQEKLPVNTVLTLTATSKNQKFMPVSATATVNDQDKATANLVIKQLGGIFATYSATDNQSCVGILYDGNGYLQARYDYDGSQLTISELADGTYTLVTMGNSQFFNSVGQLSQFAESGLRAGQEYVKNTVTVESGKMATITNQRIPYLDETRLYYTGANTSFSMNKSQVTAGQYLTLRGQVDFKDAYAGSVSDVTLVFDLTESGNFVANSVMLGKQLTDYTLKGKQLFVPIGNSTEQVRFCVISTREGTFEPSASVSFTYNGKSIQQPIGSASATVKGASLTVPAIIATPAFTASGTAIAKSEVYVYADDILVGKTTAYASGKWSMECTLADPEALSEHLVYARIVTPEKAELLSETQKVTYDPSAILAESVKMSFYNGWLRNTVSVNWDMKAKKANTSSYMFYTTTDITFLIDFTANESADLNNVELVVFRNDNRQDILKATYNATKKVWVASNRYSSSALPTCVKVRYEINDVQMCTTKDTDDEGCEHVNPILDPSGFVYEAVSSNRLQGVTASIYYKEMKYDNYGDPYEVEGLWNAEEYAQQNPLFTDENGMYQWDVPSGLWQVRLEKEGYLNTNSEWLPVPPPQLDVNLPMVQMIQPVVKSAKASKDGVEVEFDKYMDPATLTTENISVTSNGNNVEGSIELLNEEAVSEDNPQTFASKLFFKANQTLTSTDDIQLIVNKNVKSYAGVSMAGAISQDLDVAPVVTEINPSVELVNVQYEKTRTLKVAALPADAAKGKTITVKSLSDIVATATIDNIESKLDENGEAEFTVSGELPGSTVLTFTVEGSDVTGEMTVNVKNEKDLKTIAPMASRVSGTEVYRGSNIQLSSETENAVIYYTLDGTEPTKESLKYNANSPIIIADDNVTIKAIAMGQDLDNSDVKTFTYSLKKTTVGFDMNAGWNWISHNLEEDVDVSVFKSIDVVEAVLGQNSEIIRDPVYGFFGSLNGLKPTEGYKIKLSQNTDKLYLNDRYEFNAAAYNVSVNRGWTWISYPLSQQMTVSEALEFCQPTAGDMIVGQDGYAEYNNGEWTGGLEKLLPGSGYLYKSAHATALTFNTNKVSDAPSLIGKRNLLMNSPWAYDMHAYPNVMPVTAVLDSNDADDMMVGAFVGTECRGIGLWKNGRFFITVHGDKNETIHFVAYNKETKEFFDINETFGFKSDNIGSLDTPTSLTIGSETTGVNTLNGDFVVTPLVANDHITVTAGGREISRLMLTNMSGQTVVSVNDLGTSGVIALGSLQDGLYIVTVQAEGNTYYQKIRKANK